MITVGKKRHYLAVKEWSALLRRITSNNNGNFYCINCLHSFRIKNKLKKHSHVCKNHGYFYIEIPKDNNKILKYNHEEKSMKAPPVVYADLECLLKKNKHLS